MMSENIFIDAAELRKVKPLEKVKRKFDTLLGRFVYNQRIAIVEPVFANLKSKGLRRFTLRGKYPMEAVHPDPQYRENRLLWDELMPGTRSH